MVDKTAGEGQRWEQEWAAEGHRVEGSTAVNSSKATARTLAMTLDDQPRQYLDENLAIIGGPWNYTLFLNNIVVLERITDIAELPVLWDNRQRPDKSSIFVCTTLNWEKVVFSSFGKIIWTEDKCVSFKFYANWMLVSQRQDWWNIVHHSMWGNQYQRINKSLSSPEFIYSMLLFRDPTQWSALEVYDHHGNLVVWSDSKYLYRSHPEYNTKFWTKSITLYSPGKKFILVLNEFWQVIIPAEDECTNTHFSYYGLIMWTNLRGDQALYSPTGTKIVKFSERIERVDPIEHNITKRTFLRLTNLTWKWIRELVVKDWEYKTREIIPLSKDYKKVEFGFSKWRDIITCQTQSGEVIIYDLEWNLIS